MPRFFFSLRHGPGPDKLAVDVEGDELADAAAAHEHALGLARDLIARTRSYAVRDWFVCTFEVTDEAGALVLTIPFGDTVPDEDETERQAVPVRT